MTCHVTLVSRGRSAHVFEWVSLQVEEGFKETVHTEDRWLLMFNGKSTSDDNTVFSLCAPSSSNSKNHCLSYRYSSEIKCVPEFCCEFPFHTEARVIFSTTSGEWFK